MSRWAPYQLHDATPDHVSAWAPRQPMVGALSVGYVSSAEYDEMSQAISQMSSDVNAAVDKENEGFASALSSVLAYKVCIDPKGLGKSAEECINLYGSPEQKAARVLTKWRNTRWTPFVTKWNEHAFNDWTSDAFHGLVQEYNALRSEWSGLGQPTKAPPVHYAQTTGDKIADVASEATVYGIAGLGGVVTVVLFGLAIIHLGPVAVQLLRRGKK